MALRDYILCGECEVKLIYDGNDDAREWLEERYGDPNCGCYTVKLLCPTCLEKLRAENAKLREKLAAAEKAMNRCYKMLLSEPDTKLALFKAENILREALADAAIAARKEKP